MFNFCNDISTTYSVDAQLLQINKLGNYIKTLFTLKV